MKKIAGYQVGDRVVIMNAGDIYPTFDEWAKRAHAEKWVDGLMVNEGEIGKIKFIGYHTNKYSPLLALVDVGDSEIIIGIGGLKIIKSKVFRVGKHVEAFIEGQRYKVKILEKLK